MFSKGINDIQLIKDQIIIYRNINLSRETAEQQIKNIKYSGQHLSIDKAIETTKFPPFILAFYYYIFRFRKIPDENDLIETYFSIYDDIGLLNNKVSFQEKCFDFNLFRARMLRSYPSFIRDFHFYLLLLESSIFENISYSLISDYYEGVDISVAYLKKNYTVSIYINSKRSEFYKSKKRRRHDYTKVEEIELEVEKEKMNLLGDIYLLNEYYMTELIEKIEQRG